MAYQEKMIAAQMAEQYMFSKVPLYGTSLRLPARKAVIAVLNDLRRLFFPAYFGDQELMSLPVQDYAEMLLHRIRAQLAGQVALSLPDTAPEAQRAQRITDELMTCLPHIHAQLLHDLEATFDGDPAANSTAEIIFSYPGLYAIFVYRIAHELYIRQVPLIPRMMSEYAHSRTGIDINPGASIGSYFFIDHGTGIVVGETTVIGDHVKLYQGVTLGALSPRNGHNSLPGKRHPTVEDNVTIYSGSTILGGETVIGKNTVVGGNAFLTDSVSGDTKVVIKAPETVFKVQTTAE
jgi:serine O-acetyltransferase